MAGRIAKAFRRQARRIAYRHTYNPAAWTMVAARSAGARAARSALDASSAASAAPASPP